MSSSNVPKGVVPIESARAARPAAEAPPAARAADAALVERCRRGEIGAFEELYGQHARRLYNLALRLLGNAADAEDAVQDAFLLAHRRLDSFRGEASLGTWLYRLGMNLCVDRLRGRAAREAQATDSFDTPGSTLHATARADTPVERLDLKAAIAQLADGARAVFVLHDVEGLEHREIARALGISEGTSKSQLHKARLRLRALLGSR
jgi:RNA polymerase sigma-70 factor (ECF subfamily)